MTLFFVRLMLVVTLLCAGFIGMIQLRPYDDQRVSELTASDDCTLPCFMGIRPDMSTADEALAVLENHPWVRSIAYSWTPPFVNGWLTWEWSDQRPTWVDEEYLGFLVVTDGIVRGVALKTSIALGDAVLTWGPPEKMSERGRFWYFGGAVKLEIPFSIYQTYFEFDAYNESRIPLLALAKNTEILIGSLPLDCQEFHDWPGLPILVNRSIGAFCGEPV